MKKILFITPSFARTGSEMVLWYLLNNLDRSQFTPYLFCLQKGELFNLLPDDIEKNIAYRKSGRWYKKAFRGILKMFGIEPIGYQLSKIQQKFNADLWYVNTLLIPQAHPVAKKVGVKVTTHFHELMYAFSFVRSKEFSAMVSQSDTLIGCSTLVCEQLKNLGHPDVRLQNSFIDIDTIHVNRSRVEELKAELGIQKSDFVWLISGTVAYMKGLDTVLALAEHYKNESVKIIWTGALVDNGLNYYVKKVAQGKYAAKLIFTGAVPNDYYNYLSLANGFLLPSKEESFSLVMLEAAYLGIPIVSFNVGMAKSFIKHGMGVVVDSWNTRDLIVGMDYLHQNPIQDPALMKAAVEEFTVEKQLPLFQDLLKNL